MDEGSQSGDLELNQDLDFERRSWAVERVSWALMAVVLLAALAGLLGPGPLSRRSIGERGGPLWLEYSRVGRFSAPSTLRVHVGPHAGQRGQVRLWLSRAYLEGMLIDRVTPPPVLVEATLEQLTYVFAVGETGHETAMSFSMKIGRIGWHRGCVGLANGPTLCFRQFIYP